MAKDGNCSLEFFPPKTLAGRLKLLEETLPALAELNASYCSVTYGAGGQRQIQLSIRCWPYRSRAMMWRLT